MSAPPLDKLLDDLKQVLERCSVETPATLPREPDPLALELRQLSNAFGLQHLNLLRLMLKEAHSFPVERDRTQTRVRLRPRRNRFFFGDVLIRRSRNQWSMRNQVVGFDLLSENEARRFIDSGMHRPLFQIDYGSEGLKVVLGEYRCTGDIAFPTCAPHELETLSCN
ncbi:MAG: hypothetical protein AAF658_03045 [Myxococcota bacterium]